MLGNDLAYVALAVTDVDALSRVLGDLLHLRRSDIDDGAGGRVPAFAVGDSALALFPLGHVAVDSAGRAGVHHIALAAGDLDSAVARAAAAGMAPLGPATIGPGGRRRVRLDPAAAGAVRTSVTEPVAIERGTSADIVRLDHLGIASADNRSAVAAWVGRLGRPLESEQTDMEVQIAVESFTSSRHGVVYHSRPPVPVGGLRVSFITVGDTELEFLENFDPRQPGEVQRGTAGNTRQDQGAIARYVARNGPGLHHVAFKTPDIDGVLARLDRAGVALIDKRGRPGSRAGRIGFLDPKATGGVLMHFVERPGA